MIPTPPHRLLRLTVTAAMVATLGACSALSDMGRGALRGVNRAGESVAGRLTQADAPEAKAELPKVENEIAVEIVSNRKVTDGTPGGYPKPQPAFDGDRVYTLGDSRRKVFAHTLTDGKRQWTASLKDDVTGGVGAGDGLVLVGTGNGEVVALSADDGTERWRASLESEVLAPPAARDGVVVAATSDGHLYGLSASDGARKWSIAQDVPTLSLRGDSAPLTTPTLAVHGFANGRLVAVDLQTGREAWDTAIVQPRGRTELERMIDADCQPIVDGGTVFAAAYQGRLSAVDLGSGTADWARELSCTGALAVDTFNVYATDTDDTISAFDRRSGVVRWQQDALKGRHLTAAVAIGRYVAVGDVEGYVHWLNGEDGTLVGRTRPTKDAFLLSPIMRDGLAWFLSEGGHLYALRPAD